MNTVLELMDDLSHYNGFFIEKPVGNNAFSYNQRQNRRIFVPPLARGTADDLAVGIKTAFSEVKDGREINCAGLERFIHLVRKGQDVFIFDNHNHAFFFWLYALKAGRIPSGLPLVHVDQHRDTREPPEYFPLNGVATIDLDAAFAYTNFTLNVGNFIKPALAAKVFSRLEIIDSREGFEKPAPSQYVLDLDIDIFSDDMVYIPEEYKMRKIKALLDAAAFVTIATSPFFIDQARAIALIKKLIE